MDVSSCADITKEGSNFLIHSISAGHVGLNLSKRENEAEGDEGEEKATANPRKPRNCANSDKFIMAKVKLKSSGAKRSALRRCLDLSCLETLPK